MSGALVSAGAVGVRIEVDGRSVARTDVHEGELVVDVEARLAEAWTEAPSAPSSQPDEGGAGSSRTKDGDFS